jgi:hypothetical protein
MLLLFDCGCCPGPSCSSDNKGRQVELPLSAEACAWDLDRLGPLLPNLQWGQGHSCSSSILLMRLGLGLGWGLGLEGEGEG